MSWRADRPFYFAQHLLIFLGLTLPAGEVLGAWLGMKIFNRESDFLRKQLRRNWGFQVSWLLLRWLVLLIAGMIYFSTSNWQEATKLQAQWTTEEINIPQEVGEIEDESSEVVSLTPLQKYERATQTRRKFSASLKLLGHDDPIWPGQAGDFLLLFSAGVTYLLLWLINWSVNLLNVVRVAMELEPVYPLLIKRLAS